MSNLTGRPVYAKGTKRKARMSKKENTAEKLHAKAVCALPCIVGPEGCNYRGLPTTRHHCGTRRGGRKDHMKIIPLCWEHHLGKVGVDGKKLSFGEWQAQYGTEEVLLKRLERMLAHGSN